MKHRMWTAAALAAALLIAGCSSGATEPTETGSTAAQEKVTITYGLWDDTFRPGYEQALKKFQETNPNIDVDFVVTPFKSLSSCLCK